jgi:shikimate dehydrogenase
MGMKYRFAVFGDPVAHSKSPAIHLRFAEETGLDVCYEKVRVSEDDFARAVTDFFATGGHGLNITVPHKWSAFKMASQLSAEALVAGACNTLMPFDQDLYGHNTDGLGLLDDLDRLGWSPEGLRILILGAGGAIAGCLSPLLSRRPREIVIANRSKDKAVNLASRFGHPVSGIGLDRLDDLDLPFDLVINGISAGLSGCAEIELNEHILNTNGACYDLIYGAQETPFLRMCRPLTAHRSDGLGMLLSQAARAFELWTGVSPDPFSQLSDFGRASEN